MNWFKLELLMIGAVHLIKILQSDLYPRNDCKTQGVSTLLHVLVKEEDHIHMPVVNPAESLLKLSLQAVCSNVKVMVTRAADFTESADAVLQVAEEQVHKLLLSQTQNRHLTVTPYDYRSYNFDDILPYLTNLHTLNMELTHEVSISNICDIAENCKLIESLTLTCPALRMQAVDINEDLIAIEEPERNSPSPLLIKNIPGKKMNEPQESLHILRSFPEYQALLKIDPAPYEKDNSQIPNFLRLHTLQFFGIRSVEAAALYKCIKEPIVQTLTFVAQEIGDDCRIELNDDF
ncbi:hypothetical protein Hamer_G002805, partial [Homarus americanus]